jgi:hypothetical protein
MTEAEWLACTDPTPMLGEVGDKASERKLRLYACACCRRIWNLFPDERSRRAVEAAERLAEGLMGRKATTPIADAATQAASTGMDQLPSGSRIPAPPRCFFIPNWTLHEDAYWGADQVSYLVGEGLAEFREASGGAENYHEVRSRELAAHCALLRDVCGSPFRSVSIVPARRSPAVVSLAQAAYDERTLPAGTLDPERLALLADALEEAGCDNADILSHLRGPGPHVRGCWVVDLLLGKE